MRSKRFYKRKALLIPAAGLCMLALAFFLYVSDYYRAGEAAAAALVSDDVTVKETDFGWLFDGPARDTALIFYPGGKVEETAYAPLLHRLAAGGMDVCLVRMPFRLAILDENAAAGIMEQYDYAHWYIGGHSLGGVMAASYAAAHGDALAGTVLCAAYPIKALEAGQAEILLYGSEDGVLNRNELEETRRFSAGRLIEYEIAGGNHAQFGDYGIQRGDGAALISAEEQQKQTAEIILSAVAENNQ